MKLLLHAVPVSDRASVHLIWHGDGVQINQCHRRSRNSDTASPLYSSLLTLDKYPEKPCEDQNHWILISHRRTMTSHCWTMTSCHKVAMFDNLHVCQGLSCLSLQYIYSQLQAHLHSYSECDHQTRRQTWSFVSLTVSCHIAQSVWIGISCDKRCHTVNDELQSEQAI